MASIRQERVLVQLAHLAMTFFFRNSIIFEIIFEIYIIASREVNYFLTVEFCVMRKGKGPLSNFPWPFYLYGLASIVVCSTIAKFTATRALYLIYTPIQWHHSVVGSLWPFP